jgi:hypothetical protein
VFLTTHENLASDQAGGLELNLSGSAGKRVSLTGNVSVFRDEIDASTVSGGRRTIGTWSGSLTVDLDVSGTSRLQLNSNYRGSQLTAQGRNSAGGVLNAGFRQELPGGRLFLVVSGSDLLRTMKREYLLDTPALHEAATTRFDSRVIYAGLNYRVGARARKSREDQIHYEDSP